MVEMMMDDDDTRERERERERDGIVLICSPLLFLTSSSSFH
jgi:hypothetical protein